MARAEMLFHLKRRFSPVFANVKFEGVVDEQRLGSRHTMSNHPESLDDELPVKTLS